MHIMCSQTDALKAYRALICIALNTIIEQERPEEGLLLLKAMAGDPTPVEFDETTKLYLAQIESFRSP